MELIVESRHLGSDVVVLATPAFQDDRGFFSEIYRKDMFEKLGLPSDFVQDNHSGSVRGVLRGLHFQWDPPMAKLMRVTRGTAFLVAVDIRHGSPTLGKWFGMEVSAESRKQIFAPAGFARGFCVLSEYAEIQYKCTGIYNNEGESGIFWNDADLGIDWPIKNPIVSDKDRSAQTLRQWIASPSAAHFKY